MEEVHRMAARTRMILDRERRDNKAREERSRSRSRPRRPEQQMRGEEEKGAADRRQPGNPPAMKEPLSPLPHLSGSKKTPSGARHLTIAGGLRQEDAGRKSGTQTEGAGL